MNPDYPGVLTRRKATILHARENIVWKNKRANKNLEDKTDTPPKNDTCKVVDLSSRRGSPLPGRIQGVSMVKGTPVLGSEVCLMCTYQKCKERAFEVERTFGAEKEWEECTEHVISLVRTQDA